LGGLTPLNEPDVNTVHPTLLKFGLPKPKAVVPTLKKLELTCSIPALP
jgi:hypothetical protein